MGRLNLAQEGFLPAPLFLPWALALTLLALGHSVMCTGAPTRPPRALDILTWSPGPRVQSWLGRTRGRADPTRGPRGPRGLRRKLCGHPWLAELGRGHWLRGLGDWLLS